MDELCVYVCVFARVCHALPPTTSVRAVLVASKHLLGKVCEKHGISFIKYKFIFHTLSGKNQWEDSTKEAKWVSEANKYGAKSFKELYCFRGKLEDVEAT